MKKYLATILTLLFTTLLMAQTARQANVPVVGFADAFQDNTLAQAKQGFFDALAKQGFDEKKGTLKIIYRNAQGNIPTLTQIIKYFTTQKVTVIATCPSLSTITALQNTSDIPVCMMVSPTPELMKMNDPQGNAPKNLFGVGETLGYIDTSFLLIPKYVKPKHGRLTVGMIFNQSEPQSVDAMNRIQQLAQANNISLVSLPVASSADVQLVTASLLSKNVDAFFANPDNTVFASFETIVKNCNNAGIPIFTSEAGLVDRGAVAAYGADIYQWGYQAGEQAAAYLQTKDTSLLHWQMVKVRKKAFNAEAAKRFGFNSNGNAVKGAEPSAPYSLYRFYLTAIILALCLAALCMGCFVTMKVFNIPDITTDGSYTLGASVCAVLLTHGLTWYAVLPICMLAGAMAGVCTGLIHTKLKIDALLAGILVMTGLYSINLIILGRSNVPLTKTSNIFNALPFLSDGAYNQFITGLIIGVILAAILIWLFKTDFGIAMRATGNSASMTRAMGVNNDRMKITGLAMANSLTALTGYLVAQYQGFADINMGIGIVITGLGSVLIADALRLWFNITAISVQIILVIAGSFIFQLVLAVTLSLGIDPNMLKLITALFVLLIVALPRVSSLRKA